MAVCLAGAGCTVVGEGIAEGIAEPSSHFRRESSGTGHGLSLGEASTDGACRLVAQRSIRTPHFVYLGADGGLRVCGPWPLASRLVVVVEVNGGGKQDVWVRRSSAHACRSRTNQFRSFQKKTGGSVSRLLWHMQ